MIIIIILWLIYGHVKALCDDDDDDDDYDDTV